MMKHLFVICIAFCCSAGLYAQQENPVQPGSNTEQQLEDITEQQNGETEDDAYLQSLVQYRRNPIDLNTAEASELKELRILSDLQIASLLRYRQLLGKLLSIYEIQAIPSWDVQTINRVLPFVKVGSATTLSDEFLARFKGGQHTLLARMTQVLEQSEGFKRPDSVTNRYIGSPQRVFARYKYSYKNLLQFGITADKDAGEEFFKGSQKSGFDFYSFHLFARRIGSIKALALGDFTVNLGQGLTQWQSLGFRKSSDVTAVKRQSDIIRPYNSAGEFAFMRGAAITLSRKRFEATAFASVRKLDGTVQSDTSQTADDFLSSVLNSGYHRTPLELEKKNALTQTSFGGNLSYNNGSLHVGVNGIHFRMSKPIQRALAPYNQYAISGSYWGNYSFDYSYTFRNYHFFGEAAIDERRDKAFVGGMLASLDPKVDASLVYRNIAAGYKTFNGNAFTESSTPSNERGLFLGLAIKPRPFLRIDAYADLFSFPWLRYRVDAPSQGSEFMLQVYYRPNKQVEAYTRYRHESKAINLSGTDLPNRIVAIRPRQNWRTNVSYSLSREISVRSRFEVMWFDAREKEKAQQGYITYIDARYKPFGKPLSINGRIQYFETEGYDSRIYAFENDVLYSFSIPQFMGKGMRYYLVLNYDVSRKLTMWLRWAQTQYIDQPVVGSGLDEIQGNRRTEVKVQVLYAF